MLRHVVMFRFKEDAPPEAAQSIEEGLARLSETLDEIESYRFGADLGLRPGNFDFALVAEFADAEAFGRYADHTDHQSFIRERVTPVVAERIAVQFED